MTDREILNLSKANAPYMVDCYRALHRIPEKGFAEYETQAFIAARLREMGVPFETCRTWVVGLIEGTGEGPVTALRADMDSLPMEEPEGLPFRSVKPGRMHACGHDGHMAILLGAAKILSENRDSFGGAVKLLFQPAEETVGGAAPMVGAGVMENPRVDRVYGLHVMPILPLGAIETRRGALNASTDDLNILVKGRACHGAYPDGGADAILAAAQIVTALQSLISRNASPLSSAVVSIGTVHGGTAHNVVADEVRLSGTIRTVDPALRALLTRRAAELTEGVARALGCEALVEVKPDYDPLVNDPLHADRVLQTARRLFGAGAARVKEQPSMGGEDFASFLVAAPGAFYHLGCAPDGEEAGAPIHSRAFRLNEKCLPLGAAMQLALAAGEEG